MAVRKISRVRKYSRRDGSRVTSHFRSAFVKERREHPSFSNRQIGQVVFDHEKKYGKYDVSGSYVRDRQVSPSRFEKGSLRTVDPGRKGHTKLIVGRLKGSKKTSLQSVLYSKRDILSY